MAVTVVMEALSPTMEEGRLVEWKVKEGDTVRTGQTLADVETDKAVMELVARADGVLRRIVQAAGATVPVSTVVGIIAGADEDISALTDGAPAAPPAQAAAPAAAAAGAPKAAPPASTPAPTAAPAAAPAPRAAGRTRSSPLARRLAAEKGVDLGAIAGTGPGGRVIARDVAAAPQAPATAAGTTAAAPGGIPMPAGGFTDVPLTMIRKTIARRLTASIGPVPHFFLTSEIDMERAAEAREHLKSLGDAFSVSFNDIVIKAVAAALRAHPACNAWWMDDHIRYHADVHIGMAVAVEDGLITPIIRFADRKGLAEIGREARALAEKARARRLTPEEYTGSTFSVSNLGMFDIDEFTAVINPPEAGILAVGRIAAKPVVVDGAVTARRLMRVTMSCDHRVIDGATGAKFLLSLKRNLENPLAMLM